MSGEKPFTISRWTVFEAWKRVKANNSRLAFDCGSEDTKTIRALGKGLLAFNGIVGAV